MINIALGSFEPDNIVRHVTMFDDPDGGVRIKIDWQSVAGLMEGCKLPISPYVLQQYSNMNLEKYIEKQFMVDKNKPNSKRVIPWMVANVIWESARLLIEYEKEIEKMPDGSKPSIISDEGGLRLGEE